MSHVIVLLNAASAILYDLHWNAKALSKVLLKIPLSRVVSRNLLANLENEGASHDAVRNRAAATPPRRSSLVLQAHSHAIHSTSS